MAHFTKPESGSWTKHYNLDTEPVNYEDSISKEFYELEAEAIFKKTWLNVGRVEQLPRVGSYFTREIDVAKTSLILTRSSESEIKGFYNICRHRGNKLVWQDFPNEETCGVARQFTCKYHAWRYGLDGDLTFVQQESEFFDLDKDAFGLVPVRVDVWQGFIFVNLAKDDADVVPLQEYMGELGKGLEGYPFEQMTEVYKYRSSIDSNWKLFIDAFAEFYHAPILHMKQAVADEAAKLAQVGYEALAYDVDGIHGMVSSWGGMAPPKDENMVKPMERVLRSGLFGPWDPPIDVELPEGVNPARHRAWGIDSFHFFPNFMLLIWQPGWYLTYHYWPTSESSHIFEGTLYFVPPKNASERLAQELAAVTFKEYALQDGNTLEATQKSLQSRVVADFPLNDQEVLLRHLHHSAGEYVAAYKNGQPASSVKLPY
jgi:phenylpropionate dioxygenase-like ring-hydroxylating dioxygenase large terminal subunit